jgi:hypothetical protein
MPLKNTLGFEIGADTVSGDFVVLGQAEHSEDFDIGDVPLLMLPIRLETRFTGDDLKIRIYPDQIHLDEHAPLLTEREYDLGVAFWNRRLDGDADGARDALAAALPPRRAVWVARETRPEVKQKQRAFPDLNKRQATKPGTADMMPKHWCAVGFVGNARAFIAYSEEVAQPLACAPNVTDLAPFDSEGDALPVDEGMAWMTDYARALDAGMAITVDVGDVDMGADGLTLVVFGVKDELGSEPALIGLLEAHHYTDGVEVIPQGTPTNNTDEAIAGWTATVDDVPALFARELDDEGLAPAGAGSAAGQLADALGFADDSLLRRLPGADLGEDAVMAAMNRALWPVTWGRYLNDLLAPDDGPSIVPAGKQSTLRTFFIDHVRGGGPLPTLAVGSQPYGILPLMRRDGGDLHSDDPLTALEAVLLDLREQWRAALPGVALLDPVDGGADDETAAEVLGSLPHPERFVVRRLTWQWALRTGAWSFLWDCVGRVGSDLAVLGYIRHMSFGNLESVEEEIEFLEDLKRDPAFYAVEDDYVKDAKTVLGTFISMCEGHKSRQTPFNEWYPDAISGVFEDWVTSDPKVFFADYGTATADQLFNHPLVAAGGGGTGAYLSALRERVPTLVSTTDDGVVVGGLDPRLARRSATTRSLTSARRAARKRGSRLVEGGPLGDSGPLEEFPRGDIELPADFSDGEPLLYQLLDPIVGGIPQMEGTSYRAALATLAERAPDELELRLRETLGLASHRLDAWFTGLAARDLSERRKGGGGGLRIGSFGWIERLVRQDADTRESEGFIHTPSLGHAATAAVLRSGWNAHGSHDPESLMAVDLRSDRVRTAAYLLDGVRQGVELGDLLGCRFERVLHDAALDRFIDPSRRAVLVEAGITRDPRGPVDGLELAALYNGAGVKIETTGGASFTVKASKTETDSERAGLQAALEDILSSMDAVADAAIADSVHHLLQANTARASATLDAIATAAVPPPELRGLDTPRPGASVSHRVLVTLDPAGDSDWGASPRAALEPALEGWVAGLLHAPAAVRCVARIAGSTDSFAVSFADLVKTQRMGALDVVFETEANWADRVRAFVLAKAEYAEHEQELEVSLEPTEISDDQVAAADFAELTAALRALIGRSRPLDAPDLALPGAVLDSTADLEDAEGRLATFRAGLTAATKDLAALLPKATEADPRPVGDARLERLRASLAGLAPYGIERAQPIHGYVEAARATLYASAWSALGVARTRLDAADALEAGWAAAGEEPSAGVRARRLRQLTTAVAGKGFPLLPPISTQATDFDKALDESGALLGDDPARAIEWLRTVGRAREEVGRLDDVIIATELLHEDARVQPLVGQLPVVQGEPWVALDAALDRRRGKLSLFVIDAGGRMRLRGGKPAAGLVIDSWAEVVPTDEVVTGVALNYDAPTSRPPQTLLLAVPPKGRRWSFDNLLDTLLEGFEAAKLRAVDPDLLDTYGHHMPAIFPPGFVDAGPQEELGA